VKRLAKYTARFAVLIFLAVVCAILYLDMWGFPVALRQLVERQFLRVGYAVHFSSLRLRVLRGIVASDAVVADARTPNQVLARIDELQLEWKWQRLFHRQMPIDALRIANATISIPTPPDEIGPEIFTAHEAYATFRFLDDQTTEIDDLSGVYCGIRLQVSGRIKPRAASERGAQKAGPVPSKNQFAFVTKVLRELYRLKVNEPPQLDIDFNVDLGRPLDSRVRARLVGSDFGYRNVHVEKATVAAAMHDGAVDLKECRLKIGSGELAIHGRFDVAMGQFDLQLKSTLKPADIADAFPEDVRRTLQEVRVEENPTLQAQYTLSPETGTLPRLLGTLDTGGLVIRGVPFRTVSFEFENQGPDIWINDARIVTAEGQLTGHGQFQFESSDFSYEFDSTLDPRKLLPLMTPVMRNIVEPSWFETPPHIVASVSGDFVDPDAFAYDAKLQAGRCTYRGVPLTSVDATLKLRHSRLEVPAMTLTRNEGELRGTLLANFVNHQITFDVTTTANPTEMAPLLGPKAAKLARPYRFGPVTKATASGLVDLDLPSNSAWSAQVQNEGFSYWRLRTDRASASVSVTNNILTVGNFVGDFYDGELTGRAVFSLTNAPTYQFDFTTDHVDVRKLFTAIWDRDPKSSGWMTGQGTLRGEGSDFGALIGEGKFRVADGVLGQLGLFGVISQILNSLSPGLGNAKLTRADATIAVADRAIKTSDMQIEAGPYTLTVQGKLEFDCKLDFRVQGQLLRAVPGINVITWFLKNLFEYKIGGTCASPTYRPTNLPKELMPHGTLGEPAPATPPGK
jgi:hypothetical protein